MKTALRLLFLLLFTINVSAADTKPKDEAWQRFTKEHGHAWSVEWNRATGSPHRVSGSYLTLKGGINKNTIERIALDFILRYGDLVGADEKSLELTKAAFDPPAKGRRGLGTWYVSFRQVYRGIPVKGGSVRLIIRGNQVTSFGSDFFPGIDLPSQPVYSELQALDAVRRDLNLTTVAPVIRLIVSPDLHSGTLRYFLAWEIVTPVVSIPATPAGGPPSKIEMVPAQWRYVIDAISGKILDRTNLMVEATLSGHVTGTARSHPTDPPVPVDLANVVVSAGSVSATDETDAAGMYSITVPSGPTAITAQLSGAHIVIRNDETPDPDTTHSASLTPSATHDWNFTVDDPSPNDIETSAYYHVDKIRSWFLRGAPFDVAPDPDPMEVRVRNGAYCNAFAGPAGLFFGSGTAAGCPDLALCSDIIYHEYGHRIVERVYADAGAYLNSAEEGAAMNEAFADYFASSFTNDPSHGEGCHSGRNLDTPDRRYPGDLNGAHESGVIFAGALWDLRPVLGIAYVDALAIRAMKQAALSFSEYLRAVLEEDDDPSFNSSPAADANLANGTPNINAICHAYFDLHGIFDSNCLGHTQMPIAIITAPPASDTNLLPSASSSVSIVGSAFGSTQPLQSFTIEYASENAPSTFLSAGVMLTGGGTAPVNNAVLGTINTTTLANGFYRVRLTVRDAGGTTAATETNILVDRSIMPGWPQATSVPFRFAPAIGELDPAAPGNEIAAVGDDALLYAWHRDGTPVTGFPVVAGFPSGSIAIADLDGDGANEIVTAEYFNVRVFRRNGTIVPGWPQSCAGGIYGSSPVLGDLEGDGDLEVVIGARGNVMCAWQHNGVAVTGWPVMTTGEIRNSAALADLDGNGTREVIAGGFDGNFYVWRANGTTFPGWPVNLMHQASASPAVGDVDGDGDLEIVAGEYDDATFTSRVHVLHHNGTTVSGWPRSVANSFSVPCSGVLADFDRDGALDVIAQLYDNSLHVWRADGTVLPGWPKLGFGGYEFYPAGSPAIGDVDGDGAPDLVFEDSATSVGNQFVNHVSAFHADGSLVTGWPKAINALSGSPPTLADIDGDGNVDVVVGAKGVLIWKLTGAFTNGSRDWIAYRHDAARTGLTKSGVTRQLVIDDTVGGLAIGGSSQEKLAQTMTFFTAGDLIEVGLPVGCTAGSDLVLRIEGVSAGRPNGVVRSTQVVPGSTIPPFFPNPPSLRRFVLATPVHVNAGDSLAIVLTSSGECGTFQGPVGDSYADGNLYFDARPNAVGVWECVCQFPVVSFRYDLPFMTVVRP